MAGYQGIVRLYPPGSEHWQSLVALAASDSEDAILRPEFSKLARFLEANYAPVPVSQARVETLVKFAKNLSGQQRRNEETVSRMVRARTNRRACVLPVRLPAKRSRQHADVDDEAAAGVAEGAVDHAKADIDEEDAQPADGKDAKEANGDSELNAMQDEDDDATAARVACSTQACPNNPSHDAHAPISNEQRAKYNKELGFNARSTPEERKERKSRIQKPLDKQALKQQADKVRKQLTGFKPKRSRLQKRRRGESG